MATCSFDQAAPCPGPLAMLYILWLRVKEVSKLPRCCSRTPALLRSAGMVWDFLSAAVCLDNQASCTLQGGAKTGFGQQQQQPHHHGVTQGTRMETSSLQHSSLGQSQGD